jgi:hypothetical protein
MAVASWNEIKSGRSECAILIPDLRYPEYRCLQRRDEFAALVALLTHCRDEVARADLRGLLLGDRDQVVVERPIQVQASSYVPKLRPSPLSSLGAVIANALRCLQRFTAS